MLRRPLLASTFVWLVATACSSGAPSQSASGATVCSVPGGFTAGAADQHCSEPDGGAVRTTVDPSACTTMPDGGGEDLGGGCGFGATMSSPRSKAAEGDDDDCKYHVAVTLLSPVCEGPVQFQIESTYLADGSPVTGAAAGAEAFTTTPGDWDAASYCDDGSSHLSPSNQQGIVAFTENPPGTYTGTLAFDRPGTWTVRFHFFESCFDVPSSPHGHAAFHLTVP